MNPMEFQNETEAAEAEAWGGVGWSAASGSHSKPQRVQLRRVKGWRMPPNTVVVTRPGRWGNPFKVGTVTTEAKLGYGAPKWMVGHYVADIEDAYDLFSRWIYSESDIALAWRISAHVLRGKNLACFCSKDGPCHADVLLEIANQ